MEEVIQLPATAGQIGSALGATVIGESLREVQAVAPLEQACPGTLSFLADRRYGRCLENVEGAVVLTSEEFVRPELPLTFLVVSDPQSSFADFVRLVQGRRLRTGVSPLAVVHPSVTVAEGVWVGEFSVIREGVRLGERAQIGPFCYLGANVHVGADSVLQPRVTVSDEVRIGARVRIFSGAVIGSDGFGLYTSQDSKLSELPHIGNVLIEDDVRIGANCTIDRAKVGTTRIGRGSKLDALVHIGHNTELGRNVILCAQVGISGSCKIGDGVVMGGQVGLGPGLEVGPGAQFGGQTGASTNLEGGKKYFGTPALPADQALRIHRAMTKIPKIWKRLVKLTEVPEEASHE